MRLAVELVARRRVAVVGFDVREGVPRAEEGDAVRLAGEEEQMRSACS